MSHDIPNSDIRRFNGRKKRRTLPSYPQATREERIRAINIDYLTGKITNSQKIKLYRKEFLK